VVVLCFAKIKTARVEKQYLFSYNIFDMIYICRDFQTGIRENSFHIESSKKVLYHCIFISLFIIHRLINSKGKETDCIHG